MLRQVPPNSSNLLGMMLRPVFRGVRRDHFAALAGAMLLLGFVASARASQFTGTLAITDPANTLNFASPVSAFDVTLSPGGSTTITIASFSLDSRQTSFALSPASIYGDPLEAQLVFSSPTSITPPLLGGQLGDDVFTDGIQADTENAVTELFIPPVTVAFPDGEQLTVTFLPPPAAGNNIQNGTASAGSIMATFADAGATTALVPEPTTAAILSVGMVGIAAIRRRSRSTSPA
jgi:hypothetical protein